MSSNVSPKQLNDQTNALYLYIHSCFFTRILFCATTVCSYEFDSGFNGWTGIDVSDATDIFTATSGYIEINGFGGQADEDWFVSPSINMDNQDQEFLLFDYNDGFNGNLIELYYSTNFNGGNSVADLQSATWQNIPLNLIDINNTSCFSTLFQHHRAIDVSGIAGANVFFAFKYTSTSSNSKRYRLDNFRIESMYYGTVQQQINNGLRCDSLKSALHSVIQNQTKVVEYTSSNYDVWDALLVTDMRLNDAGTSLIVWDMFTDQPNQTGEFEYDHCSNRDNGSCPNTEGACYNREHTFPRSWWGGGTTYTTDTINFDLHHVTPSDKLMNFRKLNYPPGVVTNPSSTGTNGFKVGTNSSYPCTSMQYFEPIDEFKGDYARMFFYIATRYESQIASWFGSNTNGDCALTGTAYPGYAPWMINVLLDWHYQDSVSQKEIDRNNSVYAIQGNRNPFIDNPSWVAMIWGDNLGTPCDQIQNGCTPTASVDIQTACGSFTWIDGNTYTSSNNIATFTLTYAGGCDSVVSLDLIIRQPSTYTDIQTACGSFTWINGNTYTSSNNTATFILTNTVGCDSVVSLDLTIRQPSAFTDIISACGSFTWIDGNTYTNSNNIASVTLTNAAGCDSVVTLDLTINQSSSSTDIQSTCTPYTWIDGITYASSNNSATFILTNAAGCDSIVTLDLTVSSTINITDFQTSCDPFTWIDGVTYTNSTNTPSVTYTSSSGCDSIVSLDLTILQATSATDIQSSCGPYTWIDGNTYTSSTNGPLFTLVNDVGCDSVVTLDLTVTNIDTSLTFIGGILQSNQLNATYQWIDCTNGNILGTNQSYSPQSNGQYRVIITSNSCTDSSSCIPVIISAVPSNISLSGELISIYPNPGTDYFSVQNINLGLVKHINVFSADGKFVSVIESENITLSDKIDMSMYPSGVYFINIYFKNGNRQSFKWLLME